jgi:large subunit ribosomal protein L17
LIPSAIEKVIKDIAPKFVSRNGGYTRMVKLGRRFNDDASLVMMEWVEGVGVENKEEKPKKETKPKAKKVVTKKVQPKADKK